MEFPDGDLCCDVKDVLAARALAESAERFRVAFESAHVSMLLVGPTARVTRANDAIARMLLRDREDLVGRLVGEVVVSEDAVWPELDGRAGERAELERWLRRPDGSSFLARVGRSPLRSQDGAPLGFLVTVEDVTVARRAEDELRASEARFRAFVEANPAVVLQLGPEGRPLYRNPRLTELLGLDLAEDPVRWPEVLHPEDAPVLRAAFSAALGSGQPLREETRVRTQLGGWRWMQLAAEPHRGPCGSVRGWIVVVTDIDEVKRAATAVRSAAHLQAVGQLAGGVAHEVNNMMAVVLGFSSLLAQRLPADDPNRRAVDEIVQASRRTAEITRKLLAFGRRQVLQLERVDVREVVRDLQALVERVVTPGLRISVAVPSAAVVARLDRALLEQALLNLALNARDATAAGGRLAMRVRVVHNRRPRALRVPADTLPTGRWAAVEVADDGAGMAPEVIDRALEPFFTTKEVGKGTGLGLPMVYGTVRQLGGYLSIASAPGEGTVVTMFLPAAEGDDATPALAPRVLVVEDEEGLGRFFTEGLRDLGYDAAWVTDGRAALEAVAVEPPRLLVTDLALPGMGGAELARRARSLLPRLPILFVSGHVREAPGPAAELRADEVLLEKPFGVDELARAVRSLLDRAGD
ncbi:MAG: PAS domain S-box protein [Myxococcota bacterium]